MSEQQKLPNFKDRIRVVPEEGEPKFKKVDAAYKEAMSSVEEGLTRKLGSEDKVTAVRLVANAIISGAQERGIDIHSDIALAGLQYALDGTVQVRRVLQEVGVPETEVDLPWNRAPQGLPPDLEALLREAIVEDGGGDDTLTAGPLGSAGDE